MTRVEQIRKNLENSFQPSFLEVLDESDQHRGHAGAPEGGQSHFRVRLKSEQFKGQSRIARHRAVHAALGPELIGSIHLRIADIVKDHDILNIARNAAIDILKSDPSLSLSKNLPVKMTYMQLAKYKNIWNFIS